MKTLITHHRPHLDDICGMWLFVRFVPGYEEADFDFISTGPTGNPQVNTDDRICIGVGRGEFDEHKGDIGECATTLVYKHIQENVSLDDETKIALNRITDWVLLEDTGKLLTVELRDYTVPTILRGFYTYAGKDSKAVVKLGFDILDGLLSTQLSLVKLEKDLVNAIKFESRFGPAIAVDTSASDVDSYCYRQGYKIVLHANSSNNYVSIKADANSDADFTSIYEELMTREPTAGWYFHHSKKMLICGGLLAPEVEPSKLSLMELVELFK